MGFIKIIFKRTLDQLRLKVYPKDMMMSGECVFPQFCLITMKISNNGPALQLSDGSVLQLHVTAQFYLENKGKYILEVWGHANPKDLKRKERKRESTPKRVRVNERAPALWLLFLYVFFLLPLGLSYVNWASQEFCLFYLRSSLQSSDLPLFCFRGLSPSLSFSHHHSGLLFPVLTTQQMQVSTSTFCLWKAI